MAEKISRYADSPRRGGSTWKTWLIAFSVFLVIFSACLGFVTSFIISRFYAFEVLFTLTPNNIQVPETNILLLGVDATRGVKRSDTIMVVHIDPVNKTVGIVSIPRDTLVVIPGVRLDKINHAYAFGGPDLACTTTSNFLGVPIRNYIKVNVKGLESIIDLVGGITTNVEKRMYYVDYAGGLTVDLQPGVQRLSGKQAIGYLRFRHDAKGDFGRIRRQQEFLQELAGEIAKSKNVFQTYQIVMDMMQSVETNLSSSQILALASVVRQAYEMGNIAVASLPGSGVKIDGVYYMQPEMTQVNKIVNSYLKGFKVNESPQSISQKLAE